MVGATQDDLLQGLLTGGAFLLIVLLVWIILHHAKPGMRIDIGIRGWVSLKPGESMDVEQEDEGGGHTEGGDADGNDRPDTGAVDPPDH